MDSGVAGVPSPALHRELTQSSRRRGHGAARISLPVFAQPTGAENESHKPPGKPALKLSHQGPDEEGRGLGGGVV